MDYKIEDMRASDWTQVADIYMDGINTKIATFQSTIPSWEEWNKGHCESCRLVARKGDIILGWQLYLPIPVGVFMQGSRK